MDVDTSSYRTNEAPQISALDTAAKLGGIQAQAQGIERQKIGIESDKLKLLNERLGVLGKEYTTLLADPDVVNGTPAAPQKIAAVGQRMVNLGAMPAATFGEFAKSIPTDPKQSMQFIEQQMARIQSISEATAYHLGDKGAIDTGQAIQPILTSPKPGFGVRSAGPAIQKQIPPGTPVIDEKNQERLQGPQAPQVAPGGAVAAPPPVSRLPVAPIGGPANVNAGPAPVTNKDQAQLPRGPAVGQPVLFEEGRKAHVADYQQSAETLAGTRPLVQAYKLIDEFNPRTGPGTETWNKWIAALKANNILPTEAKNDPTAIYQEINKKMSQFVQQMGAPSDKQQALQMESNPNMKSQILPALKKLTYDTIALQRARAILPYMFEGKNYQDYQNEKGKNVNQISEQALMLDHMKTDERKTLIAKMQKERNSFEGKKFWLTLNAVDRGNVIDTGQ